MALSSCFCHTLSSFKASGLSCNARINRRSFFAFKGVNSEMFGQRVAVFGDKLSTDWSFMGGSRATVIKTNSKTVFLRRKGHGVYASLLAASEIASRVFAVGTAAVLPFYTFMVLAPKAELTKKIMESSVPYVALGLLYAYLLYLSWTPDTIRLIFASKYWLPELPRMIKMFSSEMTLASAWIHLLAVDLFAARQVYHDGLKSKVETPHSICLCLLCCPIGILSHVITKALVKVVRRMPSTVSTDALNCSPAGR